MIARDEERMLPGCLDSVKGLVDEVVLVDTGSRDATREIAEGRGARVYARDWDDDFATPATSPSRGPRATGSSSSTPTSGWRRRASAPFDAR